MSLSPHRKSKFRFRKLPRCSKCKCEFTLCYAQYEGDRELYKEWECPKCHKVVPVGLLKEAPPSQSEATLHEWCKQEHLRREREKKS